MPLNTPPIFDETVWSEDPVGILKGLAICTRRALNRRFKKADRMVGFHLHDLESAAKGWSRAQLASVGNPRLYIACVQERQKFDHWIKELKDGMRERQDSGIMILEPEDWPPPQLYGMAIEALEHAQIRTIN